MSTEETTRKLRDKDRMHDPDVPVRVRMHDTMLHFLFLAQEAERVLPPDEVEKLDTSKMDRHLEAMSLLVLGSGLAREEWAMVCPKPLSYCSPGYVYCMPEPLTDPDEER